MKLQTIADKLAEEYFLDGPQSRYLDELSDEVRDLDATQRDTFLRESAELLGERPYQSWDELNEALSTPKSFAAAWLAEQDSQVSARIRLSKFGQPRNLMWLTAALLVVVGAGWTYSYYFAEVHISNNCSGARGPAVEQLEAGGQTEYVMPFELDARYGVGLCVSAWEGADGPDVDLIEPADVRIERIYLANPFEIAVQPVGWEIIDFDSTTGNASQNNIFQTGEASGWTNVVVWFEGDRCNHSAGSTGFGSLDVDFTYRGQQRTTQVDLLAQYSFSFEDGQCSQAVRDADDSRDSAWRSATAGQLDSFDTINTQSVELEQLAVSRDLCRYLRGIKPPTTGGEFEIEPLASRTVFQLEPDIAVPLIDGAVLGACPEFADQRDTLVAVALTSE